MELTDHIRDNVRNALMISLTDKQLDIYIKEEMDDFFETERNRSYHRIRQISEFGFMIKIEIEEYIRSHIKKWFKKNFEIAYDNMDNIAIPKLVGKMVKEFVPIVQKKMVQDVISKALMDIQNRI